MKKSNLLNGLPLFLLLVFIPAVSCHQPHSKAQGKTPSTSEKPQKKKHVEKKSYKVTFIELGSVRCIPCQRMQPIMDSIRTKYKDQVKVIFYDVWTKDGAPFADKFKINVIPTQVFLDKDGKEFYRHVGYFPQEDLIRILQIKGVK